MKGEIKIPDEVEVELKGDMLKVRKGDREVELKLKHPKVRVKERDGNIVIDGKGENKKIRSVLQTFQSKIKNAFSGLDEDYEYKLKIVYRHFPMDVKVKDDVMEVTNFVGEKSARTAEILEGVKVEADDEEIYVRGPDKEKTGQTAANIEQRIQAPSKRDRRVFEDGVYIVKKP